MKILFLSRYQDMEDRGAEIFVEQISKELSKKHEVKVLSGPGADSLKKIFDENADLVIPINGRMQALKASFGRLFKPYKILITGHSGIGRDDLWNLLVRPNAFVALTNRAYRWAKRYRSGIKIVKIHNGVDLNKFNPKGEKIKIDLNGPIVLSVGALVWYKHHEKIINAASLVNELSLLIVGQGEKQKYLEELGRKKLGNRFKLMSVKFEDMPKIYRSVNLFTLPSWEREAFGLVYLEAMASNLPVVAPDDTSRREIIGDAGVFTDVDDSKEFANSIKVALEKDWDNLPRKQAEKFSWEKVAMEYEMIINSIFKKS